MELQLLHKSQFRLQFGNIKLCNNKFILPTRGKQATNPIKAENHRVQN